MYESGGRTIYYGVSKVRHDAEKEALASVVLYTKSPMSDDAHASIEMILKGNGVDFREGARTSAAFAALAGDVCDYVLHYRAGDHSEVILEVYADRTDTLASELAAMEFDPDSKPIFRRNLPGS